MRLADIQDSKITDALLRDARRDPRLRALLRIDLSRAAGAAGVSAASVARFLRGERIRPAAAERISAHLVVTKAA